MDEHRISQSYPAMMEQPISKSRKCCWNGSTLGRLLSELLYYSGEWINSPPKSFSNLQFCDALQHSHTQNERKQD